MKWQLTEVATMLTDYVLFAQCLILARLLLRFPNSETRRSWRAAFWAVGLAALLGGTQHGFKLMNPVPVDRLLRISVLLCLNATAFSLLRATALSLMPDTPARFWVLRAGLLKSAGFALWAALAPSFLVGLIDYGTALAGSAAAWFLNSIYPLQAKRWLGLGFALSVAAGLVQALRLTPHAHFNHNDLYHLIQMLGLYALYRGACEVLRES